MDFLKDKSLDELFLKHRNNIDPEHYRVGEINYMENTLYLVWNPITNLIMEYFFDDKPDQIWFSLNIIYPEINDSEKYFINRDGLVIGYKGKLLTLQKDAVWGYPQYKIKGSYKKLHIMLSKIFIPNISPYTKTVVDHIDKDKSNYKLSNLRWATIKENSNNITRNKYIGKRLFKSYLDKDHKILDEIYTDEEMIKIGGTTHRRRAYDNFIRGNYKYKNRYWEVIDLNLLEYLKSVKISEIDNSLWIKHFSGKYEVHPIGLVKIENKITMGYISGTNTHLERKIKINKKIRRIHIIIAEVFLNGNKPIEKGFVIDHINTNPLDNRAENLKICTQSENMSNPLTKKKLSKKVLGPDGTIYNSLTECSKKFNVTPTTVINWIKKQPNKNFKYYN